ncbi:nucleotidyltransferase family protein [Marinibaculum pumilum]|uniref:Nucleotidyltransferase family protein n=1 Tax=Marinibaculum pumilum TaxID=1766165 RepID=A0ABV7L0H0_9PROT
MVDRGQAADAALPTGNAPVVRDGLSRSGILNTLRSNRALLDHFSVHQIALFGSHATDQPRPDSDIDLYVEFDAPTYANYLGLAEALEDLFGRKVDLMTGAGLDGIRVPEVAARIRRSLVFI